MATIIDYEMYHILFLAG